MKEIIYVRSGILADVTCCTRLLTSAPRVRIQVAGVHHHNPTRFRYLKNEMMSESAFTMDFKNLATF